MRSPKLHKDSPAFMLKLYKFLTAFSAPVLNLLLRLRLKRGKENASRLHERQGKPTLSRPKGQLIWIHAASVGEAQSALILINAITKQRSEAQFLVTSGTVTSATLMAERLPPHAFHQYIPLDHPQWVKNFLDHWQPNLALWMESELWPNILQSMKTQNIPAVLVNARLSDKSFRGWKRLKTQTKRLLKTFDAILCQTDQDKIRYELLGGSNVITAGNLKHSAAPLPHNKADLDLLRGIIGNRPTWVYASTHDGEEELATSIHRRLKKTIPDLLTIIVPRHPERCEEIAGKLTRDDLNIVFRGNDKNLPTLKTDIYVVDTLGELGLFYRLSDIAMIGRSFSRDGGGGHNPIEAAQLNCAVLTGANIQYQQELFDDMFQANAAKQIMSEEELFQTLQIFLTSADEKQKMIQAANNYASPTSYILDTYVTQINNLMTTNQKEAA